MKRRRVERFYKNWCEAGHSEMPVRKIVSETIYHVRLDALSHAYRHCTIHESIGHIFIILSVSDVEFMPVFLEVNVALILTGKGHRVRQYVYHIPFRCVNLGGRPGF